MIVTSTESHLQQSRTHVRSSSTQVNLFATRPARHASVTSTPLSHVSSPCLIGETSLVSQHPDHTSLSYTYLITVLLPRCNLFILHPILRRSVQQRDSYQQSDFPCCLTLGDNFLSDINGVIFATSEHSRAAIIGSSQSALVPCNAQRVINHAKQSSPPRLHNP